jgi:hypothetical protein
MLKAPAGTYTITIPSAGRVQVLPIPWGVPVAVGEAVEREVGVKLETGASDAVLQATGGSVAELLEAGVEVGEEALGRLQPDNMSTRATITI